jgi:hypothetical protein
VALPHEQVDLVIENFEYQHSSGVAPSDIAILPEGTALKVRLASPLSSAKNKTGQEFQAILEDPIVLNGQVAVEKGSPVTGKLAEVKGSGRVSGRAKMSLTLTALSVNSQPLPIATNTLSFEAEGTGRRDTRRIAGGAGVGAIIGGIADGGEGAAKGAVIGGAIGTGATLLTKGKEVEFGVEQLFSFSLTKQVQTIR